jgi:hypothetical protein
MFQGGKAGVTRGERTNLDRMAGWDACEMVTMGANALDLTTGVLGDGASGVGSGASRANYCAFGIHNPNLTSAVTTVHNTVRGGSTKNFTIGTPACGWSQPLIQIAKILGTGSGTTAGQIMILYKDKFAIDGTGPVQGITE